MKYRIAIVDDDQTQSEYLKNIVSFWASENKFSFNVSVFNSAESFLFNGSEQDILLLDIEMPGMSGIELAKRIREHNETAPIVFITGYSDYIAEGYDVSALHYLLKPIDKAKLYSVLDKAIKQIGRNEKILNLQGEVVRIETRKNKIEEELENAANRLWDTYELTYNSALEFKKDIGSLAEAQKVIAQLKGSIRALGNINVDAIEEYKEVKGRYEFMSTQVADMEKAKADLEKLIGEMMAVMREQFAKKFLIINELFGKSFVELVGGGKAEVKLLNPLDTLESPIEIEVQPPGKKLQSITLLSGGEHALTAIALLFALLQVSPAPFLVLDEIEAALDDENVYRFADYIRSRGDNTQFVVITHRRGTMEAADILYGVTMQEKGVSRLLSMKLDEVAFEE